MSVDQSAAAHDVEVNTTKMRIAVAMDPFLMRSGLHAVLSSDERFDSRLCPIHHDPLQFAARNHADVLIVSDPVSSPTTCVIVVSRPGNELDFFYGGACRRVTYTQLGGLLDALWRTTQSLLGECKLS